MKILLVVVIVVVVTMACQSSKTCGCQPGTLRLCGADGQAQATLKREEINGVTYTVLRVERIEAGYLVARSIRVHSLGLRTGPEGSSPFSQETTIDLHGVQLTRTQTSSTAIDGRTVQRKSRIGLSFSRGMPRVVIERGRRKVVLRWERDGIYQYVDGKKGQLLRTVDG